MWESCEVAPWGEDLSFLVLRYLGDGEQDRPYQADEKQPDDDYLNRHGGSWSLTANPSKKRMVFWRWAGVWGDFRTAFSK